MKLFHLPSLLLTLLLLAATCSLSDAAARNGTPDTCSSAAQSCTTLAPLLLADAAPLGAPVVTSPTSASITPNSAVLGGNLVSVDGDSNYQRGVVCSLTSVNSDPTIGGEGVIQNSQGFTLGVYTLNFVGLAPHSSYTFKAYASDSGGTTYTAVATFVTLPAAAPTITSPTKRVRSSSAALGATISSDGGDPISERGVVYSLSSANTDPTVGGADVVKLPVTGTTGAFAAEITNLLPFTSYTFKAYAINAIGVGYSSKVTFSTIAPVTPSLDTIYVGVPIIPSAVFSGMVLSSGGTTILERGFVYSLASDNSDPRLGGPGVVKLTATSGFGSFRYVVGGLPTSTAYRARAFATNIDGTGYSNLASFTTLPVAPTVTSPTMANRTATSVTLGGEVTSAGGAPVTSRGIVFSPTSTNPDPYLGYPGVTQVSTIGGTGVFTINATGLLPSTRYTYRAYAINGSQAHSVADTFTTSPIIQNTNDSGPGSLRQALADAAASPGHDPIMIDPSLSGQTIIVSPSSVSGTSNDSGCVIDDLDGVSLDASQLPGGLKIKKASTSPNCRLFLVRTGSLTLRGITLSDSGGNMAGGAISSAPETVITLDRCTLNGNTGTNGGALSNAGTATLTQCTLSANQAENGGGIYNTGTCTTTHCTIADNDASSRGGGIYTIASFVMTNGIVADNTSSISGQDILNYGSLTCRGANIVTSALASSTMVAGNETIIMSPALLAPFGDYGGPTRTMPPLPGSPAHDQALMLTPTLALDQRGKPRPLGPRPDIGAVEGSLMVVTTPVDELNAPGSPGSGVSLREALRDAPADATIFFDRAVFNGSQPATNTLILTQGPLNPQRYYTLDGSANPGGIKIVHALTITQQPLPASVALHAPASFSVVATNSNGGLAYQWRKNGNINSTTASVLTIASAVEGDEGVYDVVISEADTVGGFSLTNVTLTSARLTSQPATLVVDGSPLRIQRQPSGALLALGEIYSLDVLAVGPMTPELTYQWKKNGTAISGATKSSHHITNAQLSHAGSYTCVVKSGVTTVTSDTSEITVVDAKPKTVNLPIGGTFAPSVSSAGNGLQHVWMKNDSEIGETAKTFTIKPVALEDAGLYTCTVFDLAGNFIRGAPTQLNVINAAPTLVLPLQPPAAVIGQAYFYQIPVVDVTGAPATSFSVSGLPAGMTYSTTTGIICGRPTVSTLLGYKLTIKASNLKNSSPPSISTLMVSVLPLIAVGTFEAPIERSSLNDNLGGRFDLKTSANGMCSGSVTLGARAKLSFSNQLLLRANSGDAILRADIPNITLADRTVLIAYVEVFALHQRAELTLVHPTNGTTLVVPAWRNPWNTTTNQATAFATLYTGRLDAGTAPNTPSGYGYVNFVVGTAGTLTLAGKLPDGSAVSGGSFVSKEGEIALFNLLSSNRGSHVGSFVITAASPVTANTLAGMTTWLKNATPSNVSDTVYRAGFGPLTVSTQGSAYVAPLAGQRVLGIPAAASPNTNAKLSFTLGGLAADITQPVRIDNLKPTSLTNTFFITPFNTALTPNPNPNRVALTSLTTSTGAITGSFTIAGATSSLNRAAPWTGQIVQIGATTEGYGYFLLPSVPGNGQTVSTAPKQSGRVVLSTP